MAQKLSAETYQEEIAKADQELKELQKELVDTLQINDDLAKNIEEKENDLQTKEKRLNSLKERNAADMEQLHLEYDSLSDRYHHEISAHEDKVRYLELQYKRFEDMVRENGSLKECIDILLEQAEKDRAEHADKMHEMNRDMNQLRHELEDKMRRQLSQMDISYQKEAFSALSDAHKKAMFQNAKLKDEVALQGVGLNNLGSRLGKQVKAYEVCKDELQQLNTKSNALRAQLTGIAADKNIVMKMKSEVERETRQLEWERRALLSELQAEPRFNECLTSLEALRDTVVVAECEALMWDKRLALLHLLHSEVKPTDAKEQMGRFDPYTFSLQPAITLPTIAGDTLRMCTAKGLVDAADDQNWEEVSGSGGEAHSERAVSTLAEIADIQAGGAEAPNLRTQPSTDRDGPGSILGEEPCEEVNLASSASLQSAGGSLVTATSTAATSYALTATTSIRPRDVELLTQQDPTLRAALKPLRGHEGVLMVAPLSDKQKMKMERKLREAQAQQRGERPLSPSDSCSGEEGEEERDQNMAAWITLQILDIWRASCTVSEDALQQRRAELALSPVETAVRIDEQGMPVLVPTASAHQLQHAFAVSNAGSTRANDNATNIGPASLEAEMIRKEVSFSVDTDHPTADPDHAGEGEDEDDCQDEGGEHVASDEHDFPPALTPLRSQEQSKKSKQPFASVDMEAAPESCDNSLGSEGSSKTPVPMLHLSGVKVRDGVLHRRSKTPAPAPTVEKSRAPVKVPSKPQPESASSPSNDALGSDGDGATESAAGGVDGAAGGVDGAAGGGGGFPSSLLEREQWLQARQAERDRIEHGELTEEELGAMWDQAFDDTHSLHSGEGARDKLQLQLQLHLLGGDGAGEGPGSAQVLEDAAWFRPVRKPRRYPEATSHLVVMNAAEQQAKKHDAEQKQRLLQPGSAGLRLSRLEKDPAASYRSPILSPHGSSPLDSPVPLRHPNPLMDADGFIKKQPVVKIPKKQSTLSDVGPPIVVNLIGGERERLRDMLANRHDEEQDDVEAGQGGGSETAGAAGSLQPGKGQGRGQGQSSNYLPQINQPRSKLSQSSIGGAAFNASTGEPGVAGGRGKKKEDPLTTRGKFSKFHRAGTTLPSADDPVHLYKSKSTVELGTSILNATSTLPRRHEPNSLSTGNLMGRKNLNKK